MKFNALKQEKNQYYITRSMQILLFVLSLVNLHLGGAAAFVNSMMSLLVTFLPEILEKKYDLALDPGLALWITAAVFFHTVGVMTWEGANIYNRLWWWDHFTHTLSASVVAAAGYIALRSFDERYRDIQIPRKYMSVFILVFVLAFGVIWEIIEFGLAGLAKALGTDKILTQYGVEDTMKDLLFNTAGGVIVAVFGEAYLNDTFETAKERLEEKIHQLE